MKNLFNRFAVASASAVGAVGSALAQEVQEIDASLVTSYITDGKEQIVAVLTAGAAIVGAFFIWGLIKKALNRSK